MIEEYSSLWMQPVLGVIVAIESNANSTFKVSDDRLVSAETTLL